MILSFTLSMPNNNSWNGKWSGEDKFYARTHNFGRTKKSNDRAKAILGKRSYYYNFGDGWCAAVKVKEIDNKEASRINKVTDGFCGYEWMIDEILLYGRIKTLKERENEEGDNNEK